MINTKRILIWIGIITALSILIMVILIFILNVYSNSLVKKEIVKIDSDSSYDLLNKTHHYVYGLIKFAYDCPLEEFGVYSLVPAFPIVTKCGSCGDVANLLDKFLAFQNISLRRKVHNEGEDHAWNEVFINNRWILLDSSELNGFDIPKKEFEKHRGINMSYIYAKYPNGSKQDITPSYTDTAKLIISVTKNNRLLQDRKVQLLSYNINPNISKISTECILNKKGICEFKVGGGNYTIIQNIIYPYLYFKHNEIFYLEENITLSKKISLKIYSPINLMPDFNSYDFRIGFYLGILFLLLLYYLFRKLMEKRFIFLEIRKRKSYI